MLDKVSSFPRGRAMIVAAHLCRAGPDRKSSDRSEREIKGTILFRKKGNAGST